MEQFLITISNTTDSLKSIHYLNRVLLRSPHVRLILFHVLPIVSPNLLKRDEVKRIERIHEEQPHLSGYFWTREDEEQMILAFQEARRLLLEGGFAEEQITTRFCVQTDDLSHIILKEARHLKCSTIVLGRRGLTPLKELLLGRVSSAVTKQVREMTVLIVAD